MTCNGILRKSETACYACGTVAPTSATEKGGGKRFAAVVTVLFFASLALTIASLFTSFTPRFALCAAVSIVLLFVKSSADQISEKKS